MTYDEEEALAAEAAWKAERVTAAKCFARCAHRGQTYGVEPYYDAHVLKVWELVQRYDHHTQVIALLHDVCEDTDVTFDEVAALFGTIERDAVMLLTDPPGDAPRRAGQDRPNRKARKAASNKALAASFDTDALIVKAADRLVNVRSCIATKNEGLLRMYRQEYPEFKKACYREEGFAPEIWVELDELLGPFSRFKEGA